MKKKLRLKMASGRFKSAGPGQPHPGFRQSP